LTNNKYFVIVLSDNCLAIKIIYQCHARSPIAVGFQLISSNS